MRGRGDALPPPVRKRGWHKANRTKSTPVFTRANAALCGRYGTASHLPAHGGEVHPAGRTLCAAVHCRLNDYSSHPNYPEVLIFSLIPPQKQRNLNQSLCLILSI